MNGIERCPVCRYHEASVSGFTLLGTANACVDCIEHRAELPVEIYRAFHAAKSQESVGPFSKAAIAALKRATVWMGPDEGYLGLKEYEERVSKQMPVLTHEEIEDNRFAKEMASKIIRTAPKRDELERRQTVWQRVCAFFHGITDAWRSAVDAGL